MSAMHKGGGVAAAVAASVLSVFGDDNGDPQRAIAAKREARVAVVAHDALAGGKSCYFFGSGRTTRVTCVPAADK